VISTEIFQQLVQSTNDSIVVTLATPLAPPGPIVSYVNPAFTALTGYRPEEIIGKSTRLLHGPNTDAETVARVRAAMQAERPIRVELLHYTKTGEQHWLDINVVPLRGAHGQVTHFAAIERDLTATKQLQDELTRLANTDALTGLLNRRRFMECASSEFARAGRYRRELAILMLDVDHFKHINDTHGHATGDQTLMNMAQCMQRLLRATDWPARWGGEEFAVLMPETTLAGAALLAERLRAELAALEVETPGGPLRFTISIGVAARADDDRHFMALMERADAALYAAKHGGRNRVHIHDTGEACTG
jgi:diguanylate cyclase (GGDEF)-like protein/PAS domain S-box-containing protein